MRVRLREDAPSRSDPRPSGMGFSRPVGLDEDRPGGRCGCGCEPDDGTGASDVFVIRDRVQDYIDHNGDAHYTWHTLGAGPGIARHVRKEADDSTGHTTITGTITLAWTPEHEMPRETCVVDDPHGHRWTVTAINPTPGVLRLTVERVEDGD